METYKIDYENYNIFMYCLLVFCDCLCLSVNLSNSHLMANIYKRRNIVDNGSVSVSKVVITESQKQ